VDREVGQKVQNARGKEHTPLATEYTHAWCMVHGAWCMVHGAWCMVHKGAWCMVHGAWCIRAPGA